jgi:predicted nucleotidyltransferase
MIVPDIGTTLARGGLADALFTPVQQRVLGLLFGQPHRRFQSAELIRLADSGSGAVQRQLARLTEAGLVDVTRVGNQKHYQARTSSPVFGELSALILKTVGLVEPLRDALSARAEAIDAAFVYGSVAKGTDHAGSDIDLLVLSDTLRYPDLVEALEEAESNLGRPVKPTLMTRSEWRRKKKTPNSFASRVSAQPRLAVMGAPDELD